MKILYNKKRRKYELFQGIFWILLFVLGILFSDRKNVLRTDKRKMRIDIGSIEKSSLAELRDELKKLDVQWI